ncbi:MAG: hypothetical protein ACI8ZN_000979 [Bacteroidia bacterium]|jgi:hypothetical protein
MRNLQNKFSASALTVVLLLSVGLTSCDDEPVDNQPVEKEITVTLNHKWNSKSLAFNTYYQTAKPDSFLLSKLKYHINNFVLFDAKGNTYPGKTQYFLVDVVDGFTPTFTLGNFDGIEMVGMDFTIGVEDSATNASAALNTKFTDPMYWAMASGYINVKVEGRSPTGTNGQALFHIGGYKYPYYTAQKVHVDFTETKVKNWVGQSKIAIDVNLAEFFTSPTEYDFSILSELELPGQLASNYSLNWPGMFSLKSVE